MKLYHGSSTDFDHFDIDMVKRFAHGYGLYFSANRETALKYAKVALYEVAISDNAKFLIWNEVEEDYKRIAKKLAPATRAFDYKAASLHLLQKGYAGIKYYAEGGVNYVLFSQKCIEILNKEII